MIFSKFSKAIAAGIVGSAALAANATVLVFDDVPFLSHEYELQGMTNPYPNSDLYYKGFRLVYAPADGEPYPTSLAAVGPKYIFNGRSIAANINSCLGNLTITAIDNNPFTARSIDMATLNGDPTASVSFVGTTTDGLIVTHNVQISTGSKWLGYDFPESFQRLQSLTWRQGDCIANMPHMFDNLDLKPIK